MLDEWMDEWMDRLSNEPIQKEGKGWGRKAKGDLGNGLVRIGEDALLESRVKGVKIVKINTFGVCRHVGGRRERQRRGKGRKVGTTQHMTGWLDQWAGGF